MKAQISPASDVQKLARPGRPGLAYVYTESAGEGKKLPLLVFCGGYRSDMNGTKALYLEQKCRERGQAFLRFDYSGHGQSEGEFLDCTMGQWKQDALDMINHIAPSGPAVIAGSSMGGWIALLVALSWKGTLGGVIGIAAAPDFTEEIYSRLTPAQRGQLNDTGVVTAENDYSDEPYRFTKKLYDEAKQHLLLDRERHIDCPVTLIQGMLDKDVPWETAVKIQKIFSQGEVDVVFVEDGGHRLSRPEDLEIIDREVRSICSAR